MNGNTSVIAERTEGYDAVADFIATRIDKAFQDLFRDLIERGNVNSLIGDDDNPPLTKEDLENFLSVLGGANLAITFSPKLLKGTTTKFTAETLQSPEELLGGSISVSIGGSWSF